MDRITAEELIYHLNRRYGKGTFRDSEGAEIVSDPDNCLQPGVYFFTIDEDKASDSPGAWQATQPNQRHLILTPCWLRQAPVRHKCSDRSLVAW